MKTFLTKYWKRILILIASIFIILNIVNKYIAPHNLVNEFAKYGPDVAQSSIKGEIITNQIKNSMNFDDNLLRLVIIFMIAIIVALLIGDIINKKSSAGKKK